MFHFSLENHTCKLDILENQRKEIVIGCYREPEPKYICLVGKTQIQVYTIFIPRAGNSPAIFIPRGIGESRNAIFSFLGEWGIESHSSGNRVGESGNWGIKNFKVIPNQHDFKLEFLVLYME